MGPERATLPSLRDDPLLAAIPEIDGFKVLEPCVLYSRLGEGGMGAVYRGRHLNLDIDVAVKCLRSSLAAGDGSFVQRFQREARLAAGIRHHNLVQVYDVLEKSGVHYLVMELVTGETARDRVRRKGPLAVPEALRIALGAAGGLAQAHARRIVHRDVKPDNVLIARDGSVKVSDLGLAKAMESEIEVSLTQGVMGTPQYMAPEQWEDSSRVTPAADVWAFGATLWYLLAGTDPIEKGTLRQVLKRIAFEPFPDLRARRADVPDAVLRLVERCVAREPAERFADCRAVLEALQPLLGRDEGELVSQPGEETRMGKTLVSPPPPETLARIRSHVSSSKLGLAARPEPAATIPIPAPPATARSAEPPSGAGTPASAAPPASAAAPARGKLYAGALALAGAVALATFLALRGGGEPRDADGPASAADRGRAAPSASAVEQAAGGARTEAAAPARLRFDAVADPARGHVTAQRKLALAGTLQGSPDGLRARVRGQLGDAQLRVLDGERVRLELEFPRDGAFVVELDGEHLASPRELAVLVDTAGPVLASHAEDPRAPVERGRRIALSLEFDEAPKSATIAGKSARIDGVRARASVEAPERGASWRVAWTARDQLDNPSSGAFEVALEPEPAAQPAGAEDAPAPRATTASSAPATPETSGAAGDATPRGAPAAPGAPVVPPGCVAIGDEALEVGGVRRARRIEHAATGIRMVLIPPGSFTLGSDVATDRAPRPRTVRITRAFYMGENEVSEPEYARSARGRAPANPGGPALPVVGLSASDADDFARSVRLALPTEAEWEYACRAGSDAAYAFGDALQPGQGSTATSGMLLRPCGFSERNRFGLADMHGNAKEFCADTFLPPEECAQLGDVDPLARKGKQRVLRGGSFASRPELCTSAARSPVDPGRAVPDGGVRVVLRLD